MEFSNKRTKFNINGPLQREPVAQQIRQTQEQIDRDRKYTLDAAIVRIMKSRKKLVHNELIQEVNVEILLFLLRYFFYSFHFHFFCRLSRNLKSYSLPPSV